MKWLQNVTVDGHLKFINNDVITRVMEPQWPGRPWPPHFLGQFYFYFFQPAGN